MNKVANQDVIENMLSDMRHHVSALQNKLSVAGTAVNKSQTVNEKILIMKEYQDKVSTMNSCWRSKNRDGLIANLQHENRQMLALEEENRRLRFALKEMEDGLHLVMADYRRIVSGFTRSDVLLDFARRQFKKNAQGCSENERLMELATLVEQCMSVAEEKINHQEMLIAKLRTENETLRELAHFQPKLSKPNDALANANGKADGERAAAVRDDNNGGSATPQAITIPFVAAGVQKPPAAPTMTTKKNAKGGTAHNISINGIKNRPVVQKMSSEIPTIAGQFSWPVHVHRDAQHNRPEDGMGLRMPSSTSTKSPLPRDNPRKSSASGSGVAQRISVASKITAAAAASAPTVTPQNAANSVDGASSHPLVTKDNTAIDSVDNEGNTSVTPSTKDEKNRSADDIANSTNSLDTKVDQTIARDNDANADSNARTMIDKTDRE